MKAAVLLLSGGIDSATVGAILRSDGYQLYALSFDYGQRHRVELECARVLVETLECRAHQTVHIDLRAFGGSALTADIEVPKNRPIDEEIPITYVPARNLIFLSYAAAWAEVLGGIDIAIGVTAVDYSGYPDCRPEFIESFARTAALGTRSGVLDKGPEILTPLLNLSKREIIEEGLKRGLDYGKTTSCYDPKEDGKGCGACDSCQIRIDAFSQLGMTDPRLG